MSGNGVGGGGMSAAGALGSAAGNAGANGKGGAGSVGSAPTTAIAANDLLDFESLPRLRLNVHPAGTSSASMLNDNGDFNHYLDGPGFETFGGEFVMMQTSGPGVLERLWHTDSGGLGGTYHFYVDGNDTADLTVTLKDLFGGQHAPFSSPLVWDRDHSSGGYVTYVPIFFQRSLMVTVSEASGTEYFNIGYANLEPDADVTGFTGSEDLGALRSAWSASGTNPIAKGASDNITKKSVNIPAGGATDVATLSGPSEITELRLSVPGLGSTVQAADLNAAHLQVTWDREATPAVDAPLVDFFGSGPSYKADVKALPVGNSGGDFYCYFPMPFLDKAQIAVKNAGSAPLSGLAFTISARPYAGDFTSIGTFHASSRAGSNDGAEYPLLDVKGSGHLVGVNITYPGKGQVLEGNENFYVDGLRFPSIHGTGTEDFFNAGWYFMNNTFSLPTHGASMDASGNGPLNAYRFFLTDAVPFSRSLLARIQQPANAQISSVAYYYLNAAEHSQETDKIDFSDASSVGAHAYQAAGAVPLHVTDHFLLDDKAYTFDGISTTSGNEITFSAAIDSANNGIALRRVLQAGGLETADVYIDDALVGTWQTLESIKDGAAKDPAAAHLFEREFWIPSQFTSDKSSVTVKLVVKSATWNELGYSIRSRN